MEKISYINKEITEKPNKETGNPDITDRGYSLRLEGQRNKVVLDSSPGPGHPGETGATENTQQRSDSTREVGTGGIGKGYVLISSFLLHSPCLNPPRSQ